MNRIFTPFTTNEIKPQGWLLDQLKIQANGLSGNLDKIWRDVRDSKWIGGDCEGWERVPYWLDGFIPLAYLLKDEDMIARANKYIDAILSRQKEDGWICPCEDSERGSYDMWALFLILKVLIVFHDCTGDKRIQPAVYKALNNLYHHMRVNTIFNWAASRWYECVISIAWLYDRVKEKWIIDLAKLLEAQGINYYGILNFLKSKAQHWSYYNHVVNLAMALKADSVMSLIDKRNPSKNARKLLSTLTRHHGNVNGFFNGDECLPGTSPSQGVECCAVAEAMYSYEVISTTTMETEWMDKCELLAFNSFPATVSDDMWTHQYDQLSNQPYCVDYHEKSHFRTNPTNSHLFGLEPNFGCCTANFNQAFPKFTLSCFMKANDGIAVTALAPCAVETTVNSTLVRIFTDTLYPFRDTVTIKVDCDAPTSFKLYLRIPAFFDGATVNGESVKTGEYFVIDKVWKNDTITINFTATPTFIKRGSLYAVRRGALTYTLPIKERWVKFEYEKDGVERKFPYCDYELYPESEWQYGFADKSLQYITHDEYKSAFSTVSPLCGIKVKVAKIDWGYLKNTANTVARHTPKSSVALSEPTVIELVPFACAKLRMTELPFVK